jgi:hypothetical protein
MKPQPDKVLPAEPTQAAEHASRKKGKRPHKARPQEQPAQQLLDCLKIQHLSLPDILPKTQLPNPRQARNTIKRATCMR